MNENSMTVSRLLNSIGPAWVGMDKLLHEAMNTSIPDGYPPHNVRVIDDSTYIVEFALAGWSPDNIRVVQEGASLIVSGTKTTETNEDSTYLHRGISSRNFSRRLKLANKLEVQSAEMKDGLLLVEIAKIIPEEEKPRQIEVK
jgi:molecular chaperone IbpA